MKKIFGILVPLKFFKVFENSPKNKQWIKKKLVLKSESGVFEPTQLSPFSFLLLNKMYIGANTMALAFEKIKSFYC